MNLLPFNYAAHHTQVPLSEWRRGETYEHKEKTTGIVFINITIDIDIPLINLRMSW